MTVNGPVNAAADQPATPAADQPAMPAADQPAMPTATSCPNCGADIVAGERFCESCGADVTAAPAAGAAAAPAAAAAAAAGPSGAAATAPPPAVVPAAAEPPGGAHEGTLLDDATAAATDMARRAWVSVVDVDLTARPATCANCQGAIAPDGYCEQCGMAAPKLRDHFVEQPSAWVVGVCDRGLRHTRNEDAMALGAAQTPASFAALVVCDGVSNSTDSDVASLAAARAARDVLVKDVREPVTQPVTQPVPDGVGPGAPTAASNGGSGPSGRQSARASVLVQRLVEAGAAAQAQAAAAAVGVGEGKNPPSCTFVAAVVERRPDAGQTALVVGWVGDSRAYWLPDSGPARQLSVDDSWAAEAIAQGVSRQEAENMPQSHAITRWLGVDAPDPVPRTAVHAISEPGWVLVCSDGLWNYASEAQALADVVRQTGATAPQPLAEALVAWANAQGGHDNITVTLARLDQ